MMNNQSSWEQFQTCYREVGEPIYKVPALWALAADLPVKEMPIEEAAALLKDRTWRQHDGTEVAVLESRDAWHDRKVEAADPQYPIIIHPDGWLMDGAHRVLRAVRHGQATVRAVKLREEPTEALL